MKYEYKLVWKEVSVLSELGLLEYEDENPVDIGFANELGKDGFEMFQVMNDGSYFVYYFRKRIG